MITSFDGEYHFLSNFYPSPIQVRKFEFATVEHAFQAWKMTTVQNAMRVKNTPSPGSAKSLARSLPKRPDWDSIKDDVMYYCCQQKFTQNPHLGTLLLSTGNQELIEGNTWNDCYWGVCRGVGLNVLGKTLMRIRKELAV